VLILQTVGDQYRDGIGVGTNTLARLGEKATVVRWPPLHWDAYMPDLMYFRDDAGRPIADGPFDYHDKAILAAFDAGSSVRETCDLLADPDRHSTALAQADRATAALARRSAGCDVDPAAFIANHFRDELLFFTMNHPAKRMLGHVAEQVLEALGLPGTVDLRKLRQEPLGRTFYPFHANDIRALELRFGAKVAAGRVPFRIGRAFYDAPEAVQAFFDYYAERPALVGRNLRAPPKW